ncbi:MAG: tryptophan--tRNA ligase [Candidatus Korarchaeota archaeon]
MANENEATQISPWEVEGVVDYSRLLEIFGVSPITSELQNRVAGACAPLRRGLYYGHRDFDKYLESAERGEKVSVVTGRGPSGKMHLGHMIPFFVAKWLQEKYNALVYIPISDDEKFFVRKELTLNDVEKYSIENMLDILALGFDKDKTRIFRDLKTPILYKFAAIFARRITFSTARAIFGFENSHNIGWIFYPAMQTVHILLPQILHGPIPTIVPVGIDQDPFIRLVRDLTPSNMIKPAGLHAKFLPAISNPQGKMSSSDPDSAIWLDDPPNEVKRKVWKAFTGGKTPISKQRELGGEPDKCVVFSWFCNYVLDDDKKLSAIREECLSGKRICGDCKKEMTDLIVELLKKHHDKKEEVKKNLDSYILTNEDIEKMSEGTKIE